MIKCKYSHKKNINNIGPLYSVAYPATTSDSVSVASVRLRCKNSSSDAATKVCKKLLNKLEDGQLKAILDTLEGILDPWIPEDIDLLAGNFSAEGKALIGLNQTTVTSGAVELTGPSFNYKKRRFRQPLVKMQFDGNYNWPANTLRARSITITSDAFSLAGQGTISADKTNMELKYRANLDRIQGSLGQQIAANDAIQTVVYQANAISSSDTWMVLGDCEGDISLQSIDNDLIIESSSL